MNSHRPEAPWLRSQLGIAIGPERDLRDTLSHLELAGRVRQRFAAERISAGIALGQPLAAELRRSGTALSDLRRALAHENIDLVSLDGNRYGELHGEMVKERCYLPDWADPRRSAYTLDLAEVLARCLAQGTPAGVITTFGLGLRSQWSSQRHAASLRALCDLARSLSELREQSGRLIRLCLETEPGCALESTREALELLQVELPETATRLDIDPKLVETHLGVCFDTSHRAVMFEDPGDALAQLRAGAVTVGKVQLAGALEVPFPDQARRALRELADSSELHPARAEADDGTLAGVIDLGAAFSSRRLSGLAPWRVAYHVPAQSDTLATGVLRTTRTTIRETLDALARLELRPLLEVEVTAWRLLPAAIRPQTREGVEVALAAELDWLARELRTRGLLTEAAPPTVSRTGTRV